MKNLFSLIARSFMKHFFLYAFLLLTLSPVSFAQKVISITIDGTINPVAAGYIHNGIKEAVDKKAECLLIHLNTPGGLLQSTRIIVSDILGSSIPVIVYIAPEGAHSYSDDVLITLAANIAAMAPGTNIGAADPVELQGSIDTIMNATAASDAAPKFVPGAIAAIFAASVINTPAEPA